MGSLNHSLCQKAKNKFKPYLIIKVHKTPKLGNFTTIRNVVKSLPLVNLCRVVISISAGTYREKVKIPMNVAYFSIEGAGADKTIIEWDDTVERRDRAGAHLERSAMSTIRSTRQTSSGSSDLSRHSGFHRLQLHWITRHTLLDHKTHFTITPAGTTSRIATSKMHILNEDSGFSFVHCKVTGSGALYLGRAWGTFSRVVFAYTYMDRIITPRGYNWGDKRREMYGPYFMDNSSVGIHRQILKGGFHGLGNSLHKRLNLLSHLTSSTDTNGSQTCHKNLGIY
ncbi:hypothetical protein LguiB_019075 [Lonicera macranthoides]